ncbi:lipoic acid synthetase [Deinobacterium chartae]|uniref:Lipoyl synthase n=1 Tax=Deinobacterium chartae TaxID=521158 RepID=A0A841I6T5_9DEIO|nr:lipoyl synthase [Deinobacterium chartae]MBB6099949.1 lipoic acid synthetase [Deinobacterium chartae]
MTTEPRYIKNGIYRKDAQPVRERKPEWLKVSMPGGDAFARTKGIVKDHALHTVCEEAMCPNIGECWSRGTATLMLMGHICTRACRFCAVDTGNPQGRLDPLEPLSAARSVGLMGLKYVVLTSVDRDDLPDGGAAHFAATVREIKRAHPDTRVEALTPDFQGRTECVDVILEAGTDVYAQNLETVERLTHPVRDIRASYRQTLAVLAHAKRARPDVYTKTSVMLGLGETLEEIVQTMRDARAAGVDIITFGQYLRPTRHHLPVEKYWTPAEFDEIRVIGEEMGFLEVVSGPLVRSSYKAEQVFAERPNAFPEHLGHLTDSAQLL